eukprot:5036433-Amphidinium_carterae.1
MSVALVVLSVGCPVTGDRARFAPLAEFDKGHWNLTVVPSFGWKRCALYATIAGGPASHYRLLQTVSQLAKDYYVGICGV